MIIAVTILIALGLINFAIFKWSSAPDPYDVPVKYINEDGEIWEGEG